MKKGILGIVIGFLLVAFLFFISVILIIFLSTFLMFSSSDGQFHDEFNDMDNVDVVATKIKDLDMDIWNETFTKMNYLKDYGDVLLDVSYEYGIDPILFLAIIILETGWADSELIQTNNNPGGLYYNGEFMKFDTMQEGFESMARTLRNRIYVDGLVTIDRLGTKYAKVGADNDPNNLNANWVPEVTKIVEQLGGRTIEYSLSGDTNIATDVETEIIGNKAWVVPDTNRITSLFGPRSCTGCSSDHKGIDISIGPGMSEGLPTVSFMDGEVIRSEYGVRGSGFGGYGNVVVIQHKNNIQTVYGHLREKGAPVGKKVKAGEQIGVIGNTGNSGGPHLHFEIRINDVQVDPLPYFKEFGEFNIDT